jgi:hypothetical protein
MPENVTATTTAAAAPAKPIDDFKVEAHEVVESNASEKTASTEEVQQTEKIAASEATKTEDPANEIEESEEEISARLAAEETEETKGKKKSGYQRRLDKLTKQKADAQREVDFWKAKALEGKGAEPTKVEAAKPVVNTSDEPKSDQFEKHEDYVKALAKWEVKQELAAEKAAIREQALKADNKKQLDSHIDRVKAFEKETPDFKEVMEDIATVRISTAVQNAIIDSEHGPKLMYEFAKNPEELQRISALSPEAAARAVGKLEAKFESSAGKKIEAAAETTPVKKVSTAPKPINTINSKAGHTATTRDEIPYDQWVKLRRSELRNG